MLRTLVLIIVIFTSLICSAQILNVEKSRISGDSANYFLGSAGFDFSLYDRSVTSEDQIIYTNLGLNVDLAYISENHLYLNITKLKYKTATGSKPIRAGYTHFRANFMWVKPLSHELYGQLQFDGGRGMDFRGLSGGGLRLRIAQTPSFNLYAGLGAMYETEEWRHPNIDTLITNNQLKTSSYISTRLKLSDTFDFNLVAYYQGGNDADDQIFRNRLNLDTNLLLKISELLTFSASFSCAYDAQPVVPVQEFIYTLNNGIMLKF